MSMSSQSSGLWRLLGVGAAVSLVLTACGGESAPEEASSPPPSPSEEPVTTVTVGALDGPHSQILEFVDEELAAEEGIDLEIVEVPDHETANTQLASGELDANYSQNIRELSQEMDEHDYEFEYGAGVHIQPYALFSTQFDAAENMPQGTSIGITSDQDDQYRSLRLLEASRILHQLETDSTLDQITDRQNTLGLQFEEAAPEDLAADVHREEIADAVIINGRDFTNADVDISEAVFVEEVHQSPYANIMAWNPQDEDTEEEVEAVQTVDKLLHSDEVTDYILETWPDGEYIPRRS